MLYAQLHQQVHRARQEADVQGAEQAARLRADVERLTKALADEELRHGGAR